MALFGWGTSPSGYQERVDELRAQKQQLKDDLASSIEDISSSITELVKTQSELSALRNSLNTI
jgi:prefoldin subunit 5